MSTPHAAIKSPEFVAFIVRELDVDVDFVVDEIEVEPTGWKYHHDSDGSGFRDFDREPGINHEWAFWTSDCPDMPRTVYDSFISLEEMLAKFEASQLTAGLTAAPSKQGGRL